MWLGEVCTEDGANDDANNEDEQNTIVYGSLVDKRNEPKT